MSNVYEVNSVGSSEVSYPSDVQEGDKLVFNVTSHDTGEGTAIEWTVPKNGIYKLDLFGASGYSGGSGSDGGLGGNATGNIELEEGDIVNVYVGQTGMRTISWSTYYNGGWNGGGRASGSGTTSYRPGTGGGASDIRIGGASLEDRIIVSGGGGGAGGVYTGRQGGDGGGLEGARVGSGGYGGTQTSGGDDGGVLGIGGDSYNDYHGGGGGGYYGGGGKVSANSYGGGGGSSYISHPLLIEDTTSTTSGVRDGDGLIEIELVQVAQPPEVETTDATDVKGTTATLNGNYSHDTDQEVGFDYGSEIDSVHTIINEEYINASTGRNGEIQQWIAPHTTTYKIEAYGGQGGTGTRSGLGGKGAKMSGYFDLEEGETINILVGQKGVSNSDMIGGGGGTFVVRESDSEPLVIAGGGGGYGVGTSTTYQNRVHATIEGSGKDGYGGSSWGSGGTNGNGGGSATSRGSGGGGFYTDGDGASTTNGGGFAYLNGGLGGDGSGYADGGYGSGGACDGSTGWGATGGGGGYSGGGGAYSNSSDNESAGGGGGSYNTGINQENEEGFNEGHGLVVITGEYEEEEISQPVVLNIGIKPSGSFELTVENLEPETKYYFRAFANEGNNYWYGKILSFITDKSFNLRCKVNGEIVDATKIFYKKDGAWRVCNSVLTKANTEWR